MNEMGRFKRSWLLFRSSLQIIGRNRVLLVFPLVSFICVTVIVLFFIAPALLRPTGYSYFQAQHWQAIGQSLFTESPAADGTHASHVSLTPAAGVYLVVIYFASMFLATFFNVAFFNEILAALSGQPVSVGRGLKFAGTRLKAILMWTLFAGLVGLLIKAIERRLEMVGKILARLIGVAWSLAAVFVIPIIVREEQNANPIKMLRTSASLLTRTWGEALIGYAGLAIGNLVIGLGSVILLFGTLLMSIFFNNYGFFVLGVIGWIVGTVVWSYLMSVAGQVYKGALYLYAAEGVVPEPYSKEMLDVAWKYKKG